MPTILSVDGYELNRKLLAARLHAEGHSVLEAAGRLTGLRLERTRHPQPIISDVLMPTMDGFRIVRALRAEAQLRNLPVIFHTVHRHELIIDAARLPLST
jgi:CheY-like chemotaxis protein